MKTARKISHYALLLTFGLAIALPASALRCDHKIVDEGQSKGLVRKICGEPVETQQRTLVRAGFPRTLYRTNTEQEGSEQLVIANRGFEEVLIEEWTYNFGPRRFMYMVRFENGRVSYIKKLGYGYID